ncbi:hypothetical protein DACRYDRAFT_20498 [Dacryopinax primogenitus]|uniref:Uncharacterized protein n=1 Tax=Dacryopinax primogenitus (strain DJM 731) TaxID=1858805 RepID=M5GDX1_DACPD|nr:uncharacterized protein DACRYDRAFT_20498 [Dacryopinax primogenitus]EJU04902.1 hypothetical protein DACRYDRAFT_20498 [Dacryopinax primogenitus]
MRDQRHLSMHARSNSKHRNGMFISAPNTPHLGSAAESGFQFGQHASPALTAHSAGSGPSFGQGSPMESTPDLEQTGLALLGTQSSRSSLSSGDVGSMPYSAPVGSSSNVLLPESMYSSVTTLSTDISEPLEYDRLVSTPLPQHSARNSDSTGAGVDDTIVNRIMLRAQQNGISLRPSSGDQELIDAYLYESIEASLTSPTRSLASSASDNYDDKYGASWISMDTDAEEDMHPILLDKSLPPSPMTDTRTSWSSRSPRKQSVTGSISSPEQFPKPFQHRPPGQFHLPWSTPTSPPKTPPGDDAASGFPMFVVKACHVDTGAIVSFKAARSVNLPELRMRLEQKFLDTEGLRLQDPTIITTTNNNNQQKWRLAYSKKGLTQQASRRNLAAFAMSSPTSPMSPTSMTSVSSRARSDSGTSLGSVELDSLIFIHSDEDLSAALAVAGSGKLTLHIVA